MKALIIASLTLFAGLAAADIHLRATAGTPAVMGAEEMKDELTALNVKYAADVDAARAKLQAEYAVADHKYVAILQSHAGRTTEASVFASEVGKGLETRRIAIDQATFNFNNTSQQLAYDYAIAANAICTRNVGVSCNYQP